MHFTAVLVLLVPMGKPIAVRTSYFLLNSTFIVIFFGRLVIKSFVPAEDRSKGSFVRLS